MPGFIDVDRPEIGGPTAYAPSPAPTLTLSEAVATAKRLDIALRNASKNSRSAAFVNLVKHLESELFPAYFQEIGQLKRIRTLLAASTRLHRLGAADALRDWPIIFALRNRLEACFELTDAPVEMTKRTGCRLCDAITFDRTQDDIETGAQGD
jgi:hypothetical protein